MALITCSKLATMSSCSNCNIAPSLDHVKLMTSTRHASSESTRSHSLKLSALVGTCRSSPILLSSVSRRLSICSALRTPGLRAEDPNQESRILESDLLQSRELAVKERFANYWSMENVSKHLITPYAQLIRADKLIGGPWLFLWPFYWGIALATKNGSGPDLKMLALLGVAAVILRNFAMIINDLCDMDVDGKVERSKSRPLVTGAVTPLQGWAFCGAHGLFFMAVLLQLGSFSQVQVTLGAIQLLLNGTYPLSKRWTCWTPAYLGLAINWGAFLGWTAVRGTEGLISGIFPSFLAAWCWTMVYETIYAHQDAKDDVKAGIKSITSIFGQNTRIWLSSFTTVFAASLCLTGHNAKLGWPFYVAVAAATGHLAWQFMSVDFGNSADLATKFNSNKWVGAFVFGGIISGKLAA